MFAVQLDKPSVIFTARFTSRTLFKPSEFKSQAFKEVRLLLEADLKETVLPLYVPAEG